MESILTSIKKMLGIDEEYDHFDPDILFHINSVLMTLNQLGIGPKEGFFVSTDEQTWYDYLGDSTNLEAVKSYIYLKVKMIFDPPASSTILEAMKQQASEFEWRLNLQVETEV
jgi:hypothetical protein